MFALFVTLTVQKRETETGHGEGQEEGEGGTSVAKLIFINNIHKIDNLFSPTLVKGEELWNVIFLLHSCGRNLLQTIHLLLVCCFLTC